MSAVHQRRVFAGARTPDFVFAPVRGRSRAQSFELVPRRRTGIPMGMKAPEPAPVIVADEAALLGWMEAAQCGDRFVYHVGHLGTDRARETSRLAPAAREMLGRIADRVMALVLEDLLLAAQARLDDGRTAYIAIKAGARADRRARR